jgi:hypothetical protein
VLSRLSELRSSDREEAVFATGLGTARSGVPAPQAREALLLRAMPLTCLPNCYNPVYVLQPH